MNKVYFCLFISAVAVQVPSFGMLTSHENEKMPGMLTAYNKMPSWYKDKIQQQVPIHEGRFHISDDFDTKQSKIKIALKAMRNKSNDQNFEFIMIDNKIKLRPSKDYALESALLPNEFFLNLGKKYGTAKELRQTCRSFNEEFNSPNLTYMRAICNNSKNLRPFIMFPQQSSEYIYNNRLLNAFAFSIVTGDVKTTDILFTKLESLRIDPKMYIHYKNWLLVELMGNDRKETFAAVIGKDPFGYNNFSFTGQVAKYNPDSFPYLSDTEFVSVGSLIDEIYQTDAHLLKKQYIILCRQNGCKSWRNI